MSKGIPAPAETIHDATEVAAIKAMRQVRGRGSEGTYADRLAGGEVLWFPRPRRTLKGIGSSVSRRGYTVKMRSAERDGVAGCYVWAVKRPVVDA